VVGLVILVLSSGLAKGFVDASRARTCGLAIPDSPKHSLVFGVETPSRRLLASIWLWVLLWAGDSVNSAMVWSFCVAGSGLQWFGLIIELSVCFLTWSISCSLVGGRSDGDLVSFRILLLSVLW